MMRRSVASVRGDAEFNMGRRIVHGFASRSLLLRAKVPCAVAHESLHETAARYGAEERRRRETFESKRLVSPLRGSIETWLLTHGLRRGRRLFRAFGALRNGNGFAPKHRTLQPTRAFPRALLLRAGRSCAGHCAPRQRVEDSADASLRALRQLVPGAVPELPCVAKRLVAGLDATEEEDGLSRRHVRNAVERPLLRRRTLKT